MSEERRSGNCVCMGAGPMVTRMIRNLGPAEAGEHFRAARVEFLKGIRSLLDWRIEQLSKPARQQDVGTAVPVE